MRYYGSERQSDTQKEHGRDGLTGKLDKEIAALQKAQPDASAGKVAQKLYFAALGDLQLKNGQYKQAEKSLRSADAGLSNRT